MNKYVSLLASLAIHLAIILGLALLTWAVQSVGAITIVARQAESEEELEIVFLEVAETEGTTFQGDLSPAGIPMTDVSLVGSHKMGIRGKGTGTLGGISVHGSVALICDVSASMQHDLDALLDELAQKFPGSTVILVPGCCIDDFQEFVRLQEAYRDKQRYNFYDPELHRQQFVEIKARKYRDRGFDLHFAWAGAPSEALRQALELPAAGVIFNCDLQDGIGRIYARKITDAYRNSGKTLSIRSLNHDAPTEFAEMLRSTGGTFKLDRIARATANARPMQDNVYPTKKSLELQRAASDKLEEHRAELAASKAARRIAKEESIRRKRMLRARARRRRP